MASTRFANYTLHNFSCMDKRTLFLLSLFERLSDEDKRVLVRFLKEGDSVSDIKEKIDSQTLELSTLIRKESSFKKDFLSNVLGNVTTDLGVYLLSRLLRLK